MRTIFICLALVGAAAEQRSLLRAGRSGEATPLITLPDSLLFPSSDEQHDSNKVGLLQNSGGHGGTADEAHGITYSDALKEIQASRSGYGSALMTAVQESASEVVEDAREAFFATTVAATTVAATTTAVGATTTAAPTTTVAPTTTTAMTTVDPSILARQLKITKDAATARNMLVGMISRAQMGLLGRLQDISLDLEATQMRAKMDLQAVNHSATAAKNMPIMVSNAEVDVKKIGTNGGKLAAAIPLVAGRATNNTLLIAELMSEKAALEKDVKKSDKLPGAKRRVQNNAQTLGAVIPRLEKLERRVTKLEMRLYDGDLNKLVDDTTNKEVINVMEDVSRGFGRFIANKAA